MLTVAAAQSEGTLCCGEGMTRASRSRAPVPAGRFTKKISRHDTTLSTAPSSGPDVEAATPGCSCADQPLGHCVVSGCSTAGTLPWLLASAGLITVKPLARMMAWPCGLRTKPMNFSASAGSGALLGMVSP